MDQLGRCSEVLCLLDTSPLTPEIAAATLRVHEPCLYEHEGKPSVSTSNAEDLRLLRSSATIAAFQRKPRGLSSVLKRDTITMGASDEFVLYSLGGDDLIAIDSLFTQPGFVDGGDGNDTCTSPIAWSKESC